MTLAKIPRPAVPNLRRATDQTVSSESPARHRFWGRWTRSRLLTMGGIGLSLVLAGCGGAAAASSTTPASTKTAGPAITPTIAVQAPKVAGPGVTAPTKAAKTGSPPAAGTSTAAPAQAPAPATAAKPASPVAKAPAATPPAAAAKPVNSDAGIPQGGGDGDPDNAGGPNDGDGGI
jgi:hypothetical protein